MLGAENSLIARDFKSQPDTLHKFIADTVNGKMITNLKNR